MTAEQAEAMKRSPGVASWTETAVNQAAIPQGTAVRLPGPPPADRSPKKAVKLVAPAFLYSRAGWAEWTVPLKLDRTANDGALKKWLIGVAGKHRRQVATALAGQLRRLAWFRDRIDAGGAIACTITRIGGNGAMDDDNLPGTGKWVRDTVAMFLGQGDGPTGPIRWHYDQAPGPAWGVLIRLEKTC